MWGSLKSLVEDLESSVSQGLQQANAQRSASGQPAQPAYTPRNRVVSQQRQDPTASANGSPQRSNSPSSGVQSASQLADSALAGLRKSLNRGARGSLDAGKPTTNDTSADGSISPSAPPAALPAQPAQPTTDEEPLSPPRSLPTARPFGHPDGVDRIRTVSTNIKSPLAAPSIAITDEATKPDPAPPVLPREAHEVPLPDSPTLNGAFPQLPYPDARRRPRTRSPH